MATYNLSGIKISLRLPEDILGNSMLLVLTKYVSKTVTIFECEGSTFLPVIKFPNQTQDNQSSQNARQSVHGEAKSWLIWTE